MLPSSTLGGFFAGAGAGSAAAGAVAPASEPGRNVRDALGFGMGQLLFDDAPQGVHFLRGLAVRFHLARRQAGQQRARERGAVDDRHRRDRHAEGGDGAARVPWSVKPRPRPVAAGRRSGPSATAWPRP